MLYLGTRPYLVKESDVGPQSKWELGLPWMRGEISLAISSGLLTPLSEITVSTDEEEDFNKGIIIERSSEILTKGHMALLSTRVDNVKSRSEFSNYVLEPTKFKFEKVVRILAIVWKFIRSH